ncbi:MAG: ATPase [Candidatus Paraprevotella stercoravium]|uniref:ATPase n=1 Tax=Candidatus Paraprevotella stercoravium TaxID=2838725 RepID=A0A9E2LEX9_9BACT|nr:ATPase [Candidatus Paraprevotella stercoravium]
MILITDSGSSKCTWCFAQGTEKQIRITTTGINPSTQEREVILQIIRQELFPALQKQESIFSAAKPEKIFFYGAGCTEARKNFMAEILQECFGTEIIEVYSDMLGAARSMFQRNTGIACILGTGANSCLYNGEDIIAQTPAMGYILGDEGSGAYLGKMLVRALFKGRMPAHLLQAFQKEYQLDLPTVIERTYRTPMANRFLASLTPFLHQYRTEKEIHELLCNAFDDFIFFNLESYRTKSNKVSFIGSIAFYFQEELDSCLKNRGFQMERVIRDPMDGLLEYYLIK